MRSTGDGSIPAERFRRALSNTWNNDKQGPAMPKKIPGLNILLAVLLVSAGCGGGSSGDATAPPPPPPATFTYSVPEDIGDGWQVGDLATEGFDSQMIADMMNSVVDERYPGIDSVAIVRNNKLLLYWYDRGRELDEYDAWINNMTRERHVLHSTSKSFTSALIGIAIDQGHIESTQVKFLDLFDYTDYQNWDARKADITLEDALTMRFGFRWDEWSRPYTDPQNDLVALENNNFDWPKALLDLPMASDPGTTFAYNTAGTIAIGKALENATGERLGRFANTHLFFPMQITDARWWSPNNLANGGSGLFLRTRDLAKFGQLYLDGGVWQGQRLISSEWIADSVVRRVDLSEFFAFSEGYGYQWWLDELPYRTQLLETWVTSGFGGQYIFVVPGLELVVAFTGHNYDNADGVRNLYTMMRSHIMAAIN
jgi:CubicO group peptidase (beta-lactamase class C family)